ncbi:MAG: efflux transporter periplasmic adaptor subunit, partial [Nitrosomonas sp.]|nr:efflux transporter periplasmic adaptor subunit [Nitrosomonas sp.]
QSTVELRPVKASMWYDTDWLIESGVSPGEQVMVAGFHRVQPGVQVTITTNTAAETRSGQQEMP